MEIVLGVLGLFVGLFLWSNIWGGLFATLPLVRKLKKTGAIKKIKWLQIVVPVIIAVVLLIVAALLFKPFFFGLLVAGFIMLFNIEKLRAEALENIKSDYPELTSHHKNI